MASYGASVPVGLLALCFQLPASYGAKGLALRGVSEDHRRLRPAAAARLGCRAHPVVGMRLAHARHGACASSVVGGDRTSRLAPPGVRCVIEVDGVDAKREAGWAGYIRPGPGSQ